MNVVRALISVVDDDESVRESLPELLRSAGFEALPFSSAEEFLVSDSLARTGCLILDIAMPDMTGPELQQELTRRKCQIPIVFISAQTDEKLRSRAMRAGAAAYLRKPFSKTKILDAVKQALDNK
jgi:FixJ family two-component response regulator